MKMPFAAIIFLTTIPAIAEAKDQEVVIAPNTYSECIQKASDINDRWIDYKADVNKCRNRFGIPGKY